ncbi:uncharacterized protein I303_106749 [Kwoniella dejecticola CBS 10117]|uniref:Efficient mitochondria targeting-associated protein 19 n=1 Tax=Kwoniella dejecticola CBS 10117 TaxID=1296121 RepID=A0A1A5ZTS7_9TREE|nr:uncharacterized protein I303_08609 [Kwoniella dejecticola CBS 10117]OBR81224.1 hypothetical protein I303_08609 [Kwoniella dejecticola CBS 10117]
MSRFAGRGLDGLWFWFCAPITILLDLQTIYPKHWLADTPLSSLFEWSISLARDPILGGAMSGTREFAWLRYFLYLEGFFQLPCFILGAIGLWRNDKRIYPLLLAYGASTTTTLIPCLGAIFTANPKPPLTTREIVTLLSEYIPFLLIPLGMAVDMGVKLTKIVSAAQDRKRV